MLQNDYLDAKNGVDTAEKEPSEVRGPRRQRLRASGGGPQEGTDPDPPRPPPVSQTLDGPFSANSEPRRSLQLQM